MKNVFESDIHLNIFWGMLMLKSVHSINFMITLDPLEKAGGEPLLDQLGHPLNFTSLSASRHRQIDS